MGLGSKMSAEMGLLAFMALLGCFEAPTFVRALPTRSAIMRAPGPAPLSPHAVCAAASVDRLQAAGRAAVLLLPASSLFASVDVLYLLPLRDKVRSRSLEPASVRTPLTSVDRGERALPGRCRRLRGGCKRTGAGRAVAHSHSAANRGGRDASVAPPWPLAHTQGAQLAV